MPRSTGKDHARINLDIWGDEDWLDLTPPAQHLYFVLWTSPQLSYCGTGEWHPGKIAAKAKGWSAPAVDAAAAELARELFLLVDTDTSEFILRSWIKHDGLWRIPNLAVSMSNARADLASRTLRAVIVHEVSKLKKRFPESTSWERDAVCNMLTQRAIDPATLTPYPGANPTLNPPPNPPPNPWVNPPATRNANPPPNPPANPGPTPAPAPAPTSNLQKKGYVTGERHQGAPADPNNPPPRHCPRHMPGGTLDRCGACAEARRAHDCWLATLDANQKAAMQAEARAETQRRYDAAQTRQGAIDDCGLCDDDGYLTGSGTVCDHIDRTHTHRAGMNAVRAALRTPQSPDEQEPQMQPENPAALNSAAGTRGSE